MDDILKHRIEHDINFAKSCIKGIDWDEEEKRFQAIKDVYKTFTSSTTQTEMTEALQNAMGK